MPTPQPLDTPDVLDRFADPICHAEITDIERAPKSLYRGLVFYFHSKQCKKEFDMNPQLWVSVSHAEMSSANHGVL